MLIFKYLFSGQILENAFMLFEMYLKNCLSVKSVYLNLLQNLYKKK